MCVLTFAVARDEPPVVLTARALGDGSSPPPTRISLITLIILIPILDSKLLPQLRSFHLTTLMTLARAVFFNDDAMGYASNLLGCGPCGGGGGGVLILNDNNIISIISIFILLLLLLFYYYYHNKWIIKKRRVFAWK
jgi:hypothetical protein